MIKKLLRLTIIVLVIFGLYYLLSQKPKTLIENSQPIIPQVDQSLIGNFAFYYGDECPHCKTVEEFMDQKQVEKKVNIVRKEVYQDSNNQKEFLQNVEKYCPENIDPSTGSIGVPLMVDFNNQSCFLGDTPIIDFLEQQI